jgi:sigma-B regulation protein RsbU (phosphoserine phosphatase)
LTLIVFFSFKGLANRKLDSLLTELRVNENEVEKIHTLTRLGDYFVNNDLSRAEMYYQQGLQSTNQLLIQNSDFIDELNIAKAELLSSIGYVHFLRFNYKSAILELNKSFSIQREVFGENFEEKKMLHLYLGYCYHKLGDFQTALNYYQTAITENKDSENYIFLSKVNLALGNSYRKIKMYEKAILHYQKVIELSKIFDNNSYIIEVSNGLASVYQELKEWNKSSEVLQVSKKQVKSSKDKGVIKFYALYGNQLQHEGMFDSARVYFELGTSESVRLKTEDGLSFIYLNYSKLEIEQGDFKKAMKHSTMLLNLGIKLKDILIQSEAFGLRAEIYEKTDDYSNAYLNGNKQTELLELLSVEDSKIQVLKQELLLELKQKELNDSLKYESIIHKSELELETQSILIEQQKKVKYFLYGGLLLALMTVVVFLVGLRRKKKDNEIITAQKEESELHQVLLSDQNKSLQTKASLYKILNSCSKDLSIKSVLREVLDNLVELKIIGGYGQGFIYLKSEGRFNGVDVFSGIALDKIEEYRNSAFNECICGESYSNFNVESCCNGKLENHYFVPIINNNETLGLIVVFTTLDNDGMQNNIGFLDVVSKLIGETVFRHNMSDKLRLAHIENTLKKKEIKKAHDKVNQALNKQAAINDLIRAIINKENIGKHVFNYITDIFNNVFIKRLNITLFDFSKNQVSFYFLRENGEDKLDHKPFSINEFSKETLASLKENKKIIVKSIKQKEDKSISDLEMIKNNIDSFVCFPLMADNILLGSLNISFEDELHLSKEQAEFLNMLVEGITVAINQSVMIDQIVSSSYELEKLHNELNSSINYAQKIQEAILPTDELFTSIFPKYFSILQQKDAVGGDFYWVREFDDGVKMVICIDCTGHNVPGAFMTMLARVLVREATSIKGLRNPSEILVQMDKAVRRILRQNSFEGMQDGMDMTLCVIDEKKNSIKFSSAQRPIIYVEKGHEELTVIKGCKFSVGGYSEVDKKFRILELPLNSVAKFYMSTDGYFDQFGGPNVKKIGKKKFLKTLNTIHSLPIEKQKDFLLNELNNWKGNLDQIDDICVIGVDLT